MKRVLLWVLGVFLALVAGLALAFRFSPWPSVAVIQYMFSRGDHASEAALAKHVPAGVVTRNDMPYGSGRDEVFDLYSPERTTGTRPLVVWVHGGGFIAGSKSGVANYMKVLAGHGYTAVAVEYSKGRGTTYPTPLEQVNAALAFLTTHAADLKIDASTIVLAGDSAGAQIASQVALIVTEPTYASRMAIAPQLAADRLAGMILVSGGYDVSSVNLNGDFGWFLKAVLWAYSGDEHFAQNERFQLTSVTKYVTRTFPPSFITSGNGDPLARQAVAFADTLARLGVRTDTLFFPADHTPPLPHEYQFNLDDPAGQEALTRMLAFLDSVRRPVDRP